MFNGTFASISPASNNQAVEFGTSECQSPTRPPWEELTNVKQSRFNAEPRKEWLPPTELTLGGRYPVDLSARQLDSRRRLQISWGQAAKDRKQDNRVWFSAS